ncbi:MAG: hypothetical protein Q8Q38_00795 [bacterium]|nr:hypothetical protein [bacterium]MDZ4232080.1 hypothetical protein [Candidatus Pacearchaeota archaeon]
MIFGIPWQDLVLSGGNVVLGLALLPSIFSREKPALATSVMTCCVLAAFTLTVFTLGLVATAIVTGVVSALWGVLAAQEYLIHRRS